LIRVLLVDDHEIVRHAVKLLLDGQPDMEVVGAVGTGRLAVEHAQTLQPTVIVLDVAMPDMTGIEAARAIAARAPDVAIVAWSRYVDDGYVQALLGVGARGYVFKQSASTELLNAVRVVADGHNYLDTALSERMADGLIARHAGKAKRPRVSDREAEVLRLVAVGYSNKEIASLLDLSVKTVEVHKANASRKLELRGRVEIVRYAVRNGWLHDA